ncbi:hypothetical protein TNIN_332201 [Trichonephila inaurata madagascariensis]|uniref:Uncharacterized protein n=1 Tax=Trichonephila inaurata madagascariensis TaxID=2747483 RepID=A0A8X6Y5Y4_9ARAC|nr:hypothetical protein TNIN_332201 [Trichonephila inaurata madagascariensis]
MMFQKYRNSISEFQNSRFDYPYRLPKNILIMYPLRKKFTYCSTAPFYTEWAKTFIKSFSFSHESHPCVHPDPGGDNGGMPCTLQHGVLHWPWRMDEVHRE